LIEVGANSLHGWQPGIPAHCWSEEKVGFTRVSDGKLACVFAACLIAIAAFVLFVVHPGGFETELAGS
jgi:hypothetical protein